MVKTFNFLLVYYLTIIVEKKKTFVLEIDNTLLLHILHLTFSTMSIYFAQIAGKMNGNNTARETDNHGQ